MGTESAGIPSERYSNRDLRQAERHDAWRSRMGSLWDVPAPERANTQSPTPDVFRIDAQRWSFSGLLLVADRFPDMQMLRSGHSIKRDPFDHYVVSVRRSGLLNVETEKQRRSLQLMRPMLTDMSRLCSFDFGRGEGISFFIPRDALDPLLPRPLDLHGVLPHGAVAGLLGQHLLALERHLPGLSVGEIQGVADATLHLLAASLAPSIASLGLARPAIEQGTLRLMRQHIEAHLCDSALSADSLCGQFKLSRSTLYRLFQPFGGVAQYIQKRRLLRCHAILATPGRRHYIERLAYDYGFRSASQFSRAFSSQYGYSPREAFAGALAGRAPTARTEVPARDFRSSLEALGV